MYRDHVTSVYRRPLPASVLGFLGWTTAFLLAMGVIDRLLAGRGLSGVFEVVFGFLWLGWLFVLAALPIWLLFRWAFGKLGPRLGGPLPLRGALVGVLVWLSAAVILLVVELVAWAFSPDSQPTLVSVLTGLAAVALFGGVLGFLEGRAVGKPPQSAPTT